MATGRKPDRTKSLQELEGSDWGDPEDAETNMIARALALRRKPIESLTDGEIRLAVSQMISLPIMLEIAIERLRTNPLLESDYYPGDLLSALIRLDDADWSGRTDLISELRALFAQALERNDDDTEALRESLQLPPRGSPSN